MQQVAVLGTGTMGAGMAANLLKAGYPVRVWNRTPDRAAPLVANGATLGATPAEAAQGAEIIISMVADDDASASVWLGDNGALGVAKTDTILIESSTLTPEWVRELATAAVTRRCHLLDAPVTGTRVHANDGQLLFLVGGDVHVLELARPALEAMGRGIVHVGAIGSAARLKLINNFLVGAQAAALAEAVEFAEKGGLDVARAMEVLLGGAIASPLLKTLVQRVASHDHETHFSIALMRKDLSYALHEADQIGVDLTTAWPALEAFKRAEAAGFGHRDVSTVLGPALS